MTAPPLQHAPPRESRQTTEPYLIVRTIVAAILLSATVLKIHQLATEPSPGINLLTTRWFETCIAIGQIALAGWLLCGLWRRIAWAAAVLCFCLFSGYTAYLAAVGEQSCGCFGTVEVNPWYTLALDVAIVVALLVFRPRAMLTAASHLRRRLVVTVAAVVIASAAAVTAAVSYRPARLSPGGQIDRADETVVLEPDTWMGESLGLLKHIDAPVDLGAGEWTVVLYHHNCPTCRGLLSKLDRQARRSALRGISPRIAVIEVPPYGPVDDRPIPADTLCVYGRLSDAREWFVPTPVLLTLLDGKVTSARIRQEATTSRPSTADDGAVSEKIVAVREVEGVCDFGEIRTGSTHYVTFAVTSPAGKDMRIRRILTQCECLTLPREPETVTAATPTMIQVKFEAPEETGPYETSVVILTHHATTRLLKLKVKAVIR